MRGDAMNSQRLQIPMVILASAISALQAAAFEPVQAVCTISTSEHHTGMFRVRVESSACGEREHCDSNFDEESIDRLTGISLADLTREGEQLTATMAAEAGTFRCSGTVRDGALRGESVFTPDAAFAARMEQMGFSGLDSEKLQTYAFVNVESEWAHSMQQIGIHGLTADNLIPLRIFHVDRDYVQSLTGLGYPLPSADQLVAMKVQGVNAEEVRQIRALGYQPTFDELIQIRIFRITPDFIRGMEARGLKNLTIAKLVQIRIFKLDE
jgi:hypothetical protein